MVLLYLKSLLLSCVYCVVNAFGFYYCQVFYYIFMLNTLQVVSYLFPRKSGEIFLMCERI